jgi:hypothetical protein
MNAKQWFLIGVVVVLGSLYMAFFTDWFRSRPIRIEHAVRPLRDAWRGDGTRVDATANPANSVSFSLHEDYRLVSVKVVCLSEFLTNRFAHPLWHLVAEDGSPPVRSIAYGRTLPGMAPPVKGAQADALQPGVEYRLLIESRKQKGEHDFTVDAVRAARR